jgi:hypothetical protein
MTKVSDVLNWLAENGRDDLQIRDSNPGFNPAVVPNPNVWRSSELEAAANRKSDYWPAPKHGKLIWKRKKDQPTEESK